MGVRVAVGGLPVGCPTRVTDAGAAARHDPDCRLKIAKLALLLEHRERAVAVKHGDAGGVVPAILKSLQTFKQNGSGRLTADIPDDATHGTPYIYPASGDVQLRPLERGFG